MFFILILVYRSHKTHILVTLDFCWLGGYHCRWNVISSRFLYLMIIASDLHALKDGRAASEILGPILIALFSIHLVQLSLRSTLWDFCIEETDTSIWSG